MDTRRRIFYPVCADWECDDVDYDWETVGPDDPIYRYVKREEQIATYHQPRAEWRKRLQQERDEKNDGRPLWWGKH